MQQQRQDLIEHRCQVNRDAYAAMSQSDDPEEIAKIRQSLLEYCKLDTLAMVKILECL